jgi:hypothetical protein
MEKGAGMKYRYDQINTTSREEALNTIENSLIGFCEDCIASDKEEQKTVNNAWKLIKQIVLKSK